MNPDDATPCPFQSKVTPLNAIILSNPPDIVCIFSFKDISEYVTHALACPFPALSAVFGN